jgi:hypothetical protein
MIEEKNIDDARSWYWRNFQKPNKERAFDRNTFRSIVSGLNQYIMKKVFEGYFVQLSGGESLGRIGVLGKIRKPYIDEKGEIKGVAVAWGKTYKLWNENPQAKAEGRKIYCLNEHTHGIGYNLVWVKTDAKLKNKTFYSFRFSFHNKRKMKELADSGLVNQFNLRIKKHFENGRTENNKDFQTFAEAFAQGSQNT